jgi:hypothetical protein
MVAERQTAGDDAADRLFQGMTPTAHHRLRTDKTKPGVDVSTPGLQIQ